MKRVLVTSFGGRRLAAASLALALQLADANSAAAAAAPAARPDSVEALRAARRQAADRSRRVIFNNDGNEPVYLCKTTAPEELLSYRTAPLAGTHVDAIFYCTWSSGFGLFTHGTKVGYVFSTREGLFSRNLAPEMLAAGTDPLRVMVDFGRKHRVEVFWSFRLNDTHDGSTADYGPIMFRANPLKREHPEWLIGTPQQKPKFGAWSAVDFARPEIRDLAFRYVEEVCRNYDVDGVEIDFFRHPVFFKRAAQAGTECNDEERAAMSGLIERIRAMTEAEGLRRGRPILVAVRVPDSVAYCRAIGLDLPRWLEAGWVDLLMTGGYFRLNDHATSVALGRKHGVKVYPSLDESRVRDPDARKLRSTTAAYRGRALEAWAAGVDGVYLFNSFNPKDPIWRELGDPAGLAAAPHDYFASVLGVGAAAGGALPHASFQQIPRLNPAAPLPLKPGTTETARFVAGNRPANRGMAVTLRLQFNRPAAAGTVTVTLNDSAVAVSRSEGQWIECTVSPEQMRTGPNAVAVTLAPAAPPLAWTDLQCQVRPATP
ncbi:MAG: family 10 glycosylhydrolase [Verrucomicrobia bacterium]|nr:family 10 glycosylhydrolase [Verrucomicrobiota bacterium]